MPSARLTRKANTNFAKSNKNIILFGKTYMAERMSQYVEHIARKSGFECLELGRMVCVPAHINEY